MKLLFKTLVLSIPLIIIYSFSDVSSENEFIPKKLAAPTELIDSDWVDSIMDTLTLDEKICQLIMVPAYANMDKKYEQGLLNQIEKLQVGGVILMKGSPTKSVSLLNKLQNKANIPLMVAIDGEWGPSMRIDSVLTFPKAMALGAIDNDQVIYDVGEQIAAQCSRMGIHINFAPVIDINTTYNNPIINMRSFGSSSKNVARKGLAYAIGMQNSGVLAVGKHFPGHGSTFSDSHKTLPVLYHSKEQMLNIDMFPFEKMIHNELGGVMVAHIAYPSLDARVNRPASLSSNIIDTLLKGRFEFKGLIFTDALNMKGVTKYYKPGEIEVEALKAGNDVLLYPENIREALIKIKQAIQYGILTEELINEKCKKVLKAKRWFGLDSYKPTRTNDLLNDLNSVDAQKVRYEAIKESLTLVKNFEDLVPFKNLDEVKLLIINIGEEKSEAFAKGVNRYKSAATLNIVSPVYGPELERLRDTLLYYTHVVVVQNGVSEWPFNKFKLKPWQIDLAQTIAGLKPSCMVFTGNPYALKFYNDLYKFKSILLTYSTSPMVLDLASQALFGGIEIKGKLPIDINNDLKAGVGMKCVKSRLEYTEPFVFGLKNNVFFKADSLIGAAMNMKATPGCQVVYAREGKVIYNKCFGYKTYERTIPIEPNDIYDLASVTKVTATTLSLMKMYEDKLMDPIAKLSSYLPELKKTDKKSVRINQVLSHQSGLRSWIPFYKNTFDADGKLRGDLYAQDSTENYSVQVAQNLFLREDYIDSIYKAIQDTALYKKKRYRYSDLGFYWFSKLVQLQTGEPLDVYAEKAFYKPLGMDFTTFNPLKKKCNYSIVPSEADSYFRNQDIEGFVHDPGAALLGGVCGHAGLFSNANDLAKLGQLFLNGGYYGYKTYFSNNTLKVFNKQYYKRKNNRRALGFDKPALEVEEPGPTCKSASPNSFGHSGFTGTYFWVDPENESVFIFLSNRTYPSQENKKLVANNFRTDIQQVFYDVFNEHEGLNISN